jgi:hypothetical protein
MRYFGVIGHEDCERVATPVGELCARCDELIDASDSGVTMPHVSVDGGCVDRPLHHECFMRTMAGSVMHQMKLCSCFVAGANEDDDPRLSRRQSAELATALWYYRQWI